METDRILRRSRESHASLLSAMSLALSNERHMSESALAIADKARVLAQHDCTSWQSQAAKLTTALDNELVSAAGLRTQLAAAQGRWAEASAATVNARWQVI